MGNGKLYQHWKPCSRLNQELHLKSSLPLLCCPVLFKWGCKLNFSQYLQPPNLNFSWPGCQMGTAVAVMSFTKSCFWDCRSRNTFPRATGVVAFTLTLLRFERRAEDDEADSFRVPSSTLAGLGLHNTDARYHIIFRFVQIFCCHLYKSTLSGKRLFNILNRNLWNNAKRCEWKIVPRNTGAGTLWRNRWSSFRRMWGGLSCPHGGEKLSLSEQSVFDGHATLSEAWPAKTPETLAGSLTASKPCDVAETALLQETWPEEAGTKRSDTISASSLSLICSTLGNSNARTSGLSATLVRMRIQKVQTLLKVDFAVTTPYCFQRIKKNKRICASRYRNRVWNHSLRKFPWGSARSFRNMTTDRIELHLGSVRIESHLLHLFTTLQILNGKMPGKAKNSSCIMHQRHGVPWTYFKLKDQHLVVVQRLA